MTARLTAAQRRHIWDAVPEMPALTPSELDALREIANGETRHPAAGRVMAGIRGYYAVWDDTTGWRLTPAGRAALGGGK